MNDNVRKVFDILGLEPNEKFKICGRGTSKTIYTIDEDLFISADREYIYGSLLTGLLNGHYKIIKLPKESKKKLRDLTSEEYYKWVLEKCYGECKNCIFDKVKCGSGQDCWVNNKDFYSDKFLDQEIEGGEE